MPRCYTGWVNPGPPKSGALLTLVRVLFVVETALFVFYAGCSLFFQFTFFGSGGEGGFNPFLLPVPALFLWIWLCVRLQRRARAKGDERARLAFIALVLIVGAVLLLPLLGILPSLIR